MSLIREIVILCLLFGSIGCQTPTIATATETEDIVTDGTIIETSTDILRNETSDTPNTEIVTDGTIIDISTDILRNETSDTLHTEINTKDTIISSEPITEKEKETTTEVVSVTEVNSTVVSDTPTNPLVTSTSIVIIKPSACSSSPCKNNGVCSEDLSDSDIYSCKCAKGFTGTRCQVIDACIASNHTNLCRNGACVYQSDGLSRFCQCFYGMFWDEKKEECSEPRAPCFPNPCLNNGTCGEYQGNFKCDCLTGYEGSTCSIVNECGEDQCRFGTCVTNENFKLCECNQNFYWDDSSRACEAVDACHPNPCKNNGQCEPDSSGYNCTCSNNYIGKTCDIQDFCAAPDDGSEVCKNGACVAADGYKKCHCNEGYFLNEDSHNCEAINLPCYPNPCKNYGICTPLDSNLYNCTCSEGFAGKSCTDFDYCVLDGGNVFCGEASCINNRNLATFYCSCESDYYFDYVSRRCIKTDFCPLMICKENEICEYSTCICKEHYKWNNSSEKCEPHFCDSNPCPTQDLVCSEGNGLKEYECACKNGHAFDGTSCKYGSTCLFPNLNACEQICEDLEEGYACKCEEDFNLKDNKTCEFVGNSTCANKTCSLGSCVMTEEEKCICPPGFIEQEGACKDLCSVGALPEGFCPGNQCETTSTGFRCKCEGKYILSSDKTTCTVRKMCQRSEEGWKTCTARNAICMEDWNSDVGYRCQCDIGQVEIEGRICEDVCSIEENQKICSMFGAKCDVDSYGNKTCKCPPYYQPFEDGKSCNKSALFSYIWTLPLNPTAYEKALNNPVKMERQANAEYTVDYKRVQKDVQKAIEKRIPGLLHINVLSYMRNKNYILCKVEMQFKSVTKENLKRLGLPEACQTNTKSASSCLISPSLVLQKDYVKDFATVRRTDPCDSDIKDELCESETLCTSSSYDTSFNCTCKTGFAVRNKIYPFGIIKSSIESCRDIDECSLTNPCPQNMKCKNTFGSYECACKPGYRVDKDSSNEKCVELCDPNPCVHGVCRELADNDFQCRCDAGYRGSLCDLQDENFKRARTNTIVVGAVLGGALLVTIILSYAFISRLKKRKYTDDPDNMLYATEMTERRNVDSGTINNAYQRD